MPPNNAFERAESAQPASMRGRSTRALDSHMMRSLFHLAASIGIVCFALSGCATEAVGTVAPEAGSDSATFYANARAWRIVPDAMTAAVSIDSVDGLKTKASASKVIVSPGHHKLTVTCRYGFDHRTVELDVDAKAGGKYAVGVEFGGRSGSCTPLISEAK